MQPGRFLAVVDMQDEASYVSMPGVEYGRTGPFAVSFWIQPNMTGGDHLLLPRPHGHGVS